MFNVDVTQLGQTRPPDRAITGDAFVIERDGVLYYPHKGEHITLRGEPSNRFIEDLVRFMYLALTAMKESMGMLTEAEAAEFEKLFGRVRKALSNHIVEWVWTDTFGKAFPSPPTAEDLEDVPMSDLLELALLIIPDEALPSMTKE